MSLPGGTHEFNHSQLLERFYFLKKGDGEWQSLHQVKISRILRAWVSTKPLEPIRSGAEAQLHICSMRPWVFLLFWSFHLESLPLAPNPGVKCCSFPLSSLRCVLLLTPLLQLYSAIPACHHPDTSQKLLKPLSLRWKEFITVGLFLIPLYM